MLTFFIRKNCDCCCLSDETVFSEMLGSSSLFRLPVVFAIVLKFMAVVFSISDGL